MLDKMCHLINFFYCIATSAQLLDINYFKWHLKQFSSLYHKNVNNFFFCKGYAHSKLYGVAMKLLNLIKKQKLSYFGHIKRHNTLEKLFLEGTSEGRRGRGRPRRRWTQDIGELMGVLVFQSREGSSVRQFGRPRPLRIRHRRRRSNEKRQKSFVL